MTPKSEKQKMLSGEPYLASDPELATERLRARGLCREYNGSLESEVALRREILDKLFGTIAGEITIEPSFKCDYGYNVHVGGNFYANFDLIILDVCEVRIGKNCFIGPRASILTATHPVDPIARAAGPEYGAPVTIGDDVWIGAGAIINPGVTLGDRVVVASGAVVTRSFGAGSLIGGVPARVIREIDPAV
jgi:maltose O-acetyltransferase